MQIPFDNKEQALQENLLRDVQHALRVQ